MEVRSRYRRYLQDILALSSNRNGPKDRQNKGLIVATESSIRRLTASVVANSQYGVTGFDALTVG